MITCSVYSTYSNREEPMSCCTKTFIGITAVIETLAILAIIVAGMIVAGHTLPKEFGFLNHAFKQLSPLDYRLIVVGFSAVYVYSLYFKLWIDNMKFANNTTRLCR